MGEKQEVELYAVCFPIACGFAIVLFLDNYFFCLEPCHLENTHCFKGEWLNHTFFPRVSHKNSTKLIFLQYPITFVRDFADFKQKVFHRHKRHIAVNIFAVMDNIGIRRVRANLEYTATCLVDVY